MSAHLPPPPPPPPPPSGRSGEDEVLRRLIAVDGSVTVARWPDPLLDRLGHDPRSPYAERFWLSVLGPSALWLLRLLAAGFDDRDEYPIDLREAARAIGIGNRQGANSPFANTLRRLVQFGFVRVVDERRVVVRHRMPSLTRRQLMRVPPRLRDEHDEWVAIPPDEAPVVDMRRRARALALSLLQLGEDLEATERQLHHWRFHPAIAFEAVRWADEQQRSDEHPRVGASHEAVPSASLPPLDAPRPQTATVVPRPAATEPDSNPVAGDAA